MTEPVMKITDQESGEVYWMPGHDEADAYESFGQDIDIKRFVAIPVEDLKTEAGALLSALYPGG